MSSAKHTMRIIETLRNADLEPETDKAVTLRQLVYLEAASFQELLDAGKSIQKICGVLASELEQEVKPSTFRTYLREALKAKKRVGGGGRGGTSAQRTPKRPARFPSEAPAQVVDTQPALVNPHSERRATPSYSPPPLSDYDGMIQLPSSTPSAPR